MPATALDQRGVPATVPPGTTIALRPLSEAVMRP